MATGKSIQKRKQFSPTSVRTIAGDANADFDSTLDRHFLAGRSLSIRKSASLLLSSSFGANAVLYAAFLGYLMGLWAFIIQIAWTLSFYLLSLFSAQVYKSTSLHEFLGFHFSNNTRRVAAACSIIGIVYFAGWEVAVARTSLGTIIQNSTSHDLSGWLPTVLVLLVALIATLYTLIGGRRANGKVNEVANVIKTLALFALTMLLGWAVLTHTGYSAKLLLPSFSSAVAALGIIGLVTNLLLNVSWQFIDNSSWQSISSTESVQNGSARAIRSAGLVTLLTVNGLGTLLGIFLRGFTNVTSDNILGTAVQSSSGLHAVALWLMAVLLLLSAMTLVDGAMLSVTQAITVDFRARWTAPTHITLRYARIATVIVSLLIAFGINYTVKSFGGSIFDFVYIFIIAQLCLAGPVLVGLLLPQKVIRQMWLPIVAGLVVGFGAAIFGTVHNNQNLVQAAGTLALFVSAALAFLLAFVPNKNTSA